MKILKIITKRKTNQARRASGGRIKDEYQKMVEKFGAEQLRRLADKGLYLHS